LGYDAADGQDDGRAAKSSGDRPQAAARAGDGHGALGVHHRTHAADILSKAGEIDARWRKGDAGEDYFVLLLAAHFTTVATFCPTDVDVRIRQHAWSELAGRRLTSAIERVEEIARWDVRPVTARHVVLGKEVLAGHQGEWFSVMAGALGRALALGDETAAAHARDWIETELAREAKLVTLARKKGTDQQLLSVVTTVAHNLGDLSRVVETWQKTHASCRCARRGPCAAHGSSSCPLGLTSTIGAT
jgi:hypothetical protein